MNENSVMFLFGLVALAACIFTLIGTWICYQKMDEPGWASIVPFYCNWVLCKHTWGHGAMMFAWFIPYVGTILMYITYFKWFKGFGKSTLFSLFGLLFLPIAVAICAFGDAEFEGC